MFFNLYFAASLITHGTHWHSQKFVWVALIRPKGSKFEAKGRERGKVVLGEVQRGPSHQLVGHWVWGSIVISPSSLDHECILGALGAQKTCLLGRGSEPPPHQLVGLESTVSSPSRVRAESWPQVRFGCTKSPENVCYLQILFSFCFLLRFAGTLGCHLWNP